MSLAPDASSSPAQRGDHSAYRGFVAGVFSGMSKLTGASSSSLWSDRRGDDGGDVVDAR